MGDKLGLLWLVYPLAVLADERTDAGAFRQSFSIQNTVRERLAGHHKKHEDPYRDEVVSALHLNAPRLVTHDANPRREDFAAGRQGVPIRTSRQSPVSICGSVSVRASATFPGLPVLSAGRGDVVRARIAEATIAGQDVSFRITLLERAILTVPIRSI